MTYGTPGAGGVPAGVAGPHQLQTMRLDQKIPDDTTAPYYAALSSSANAATSCTNQRQLSTLTPLLSPFASDPFASHHPTKRDRVSNYFASHYPGAFQNTSTDGTLEMNIAENIEFSFILNCDITVKKVIVEPWAEEIEVFPGKKFIIHAKGPSKGMVVEIEVKNGILTIWGWTGSTFDIIME